MAWQVDKSHTHVTFVARHMMVAKVRGEFSNYEVEVAYNEDTPSLSSVKAVIYTDSINTRDERRDGHLRSADFFDVEHHPKMTFKSKRVEAAGPNKYKVTGDLSIRGTTKEVTLDVDALGGGKDPWGNQRLGFSARAEIDRQEWGLKWNQALEAGGVLVGTKVEIEIDIQAVGK